RTGIGWSSRGPGSEAGLMLAPMLLAAALQAPAPPGLAPGTVAIVQARIEAAMARLGVPGAAAAVVAREELVWSAPFGEADLENDVPVRTDTMFRLASVSKPITATAVMRLAEEGRLDLDAPVLRYCAEYPEKPWALTSRQLLCHQGGVRHYRAGEMANTRRATSITEGLALFKDDPLAFEPGTNVLYSTYGYTLLGCVASVAAGQPFMDLLQEKVFEPAKMTATRLDDVRELIPGRAQGYMRDGSGRLLNSALADMTLKVPGAGLCSTAPDVARFGAALLAGRLVSRETLREMLTAQSTREGRATAFGLGLIVGSGGSRPEAWQTGGHQRVSTVLYLRPDDQVVVVILANLEDVQTEILDLARSVADRVTARNLPP
ncbi:MAG TPA: serine hydrolase domain-containing protein, partial [Vicinamibacteria bacterium]|nr:serine hydrolase domain-containing protein [Vicinamibacteria bacterium]